jgi:hypothetical protein
MIAGRATGNHGCRVERVRVANLPRIRRVHQSIPRRGVDIHGADQGEVVEDERQATSGEKVRFVAYWPATSPQQ